MAQVPAGVMIAACALAVTFAGIIFQAGKLTARIEAIEAWRVDMSKALDNIHTAIREIKTIHANV